MDGRDRLGMRCDVRSEGGVTYPCTLSVVDDFWR